MSFLDRRQQAVALSGQVKLLQLLDPVVVVLLAHGHLLAGIRCQVPALNRAALLVQGLPSHDRHRVPMLAEGVLLLHQLLLLLGAEGDLRVFRERHFIGLVGGGQVRVEQGNGHGGRQRVVGAGVGDQVLQHSVLDGH